MDEETRICRCGQALPAQRVWRTETLPLEQWGAALGNPAYAGEVPNYTVYVADRRDAGWGYRSEHGVRPWYGPNTQPDHDVYSRAGIRLSTRPACQDAREIAHLRRLVGTAPPAPIQAWGLGYQSALGNRELHDEWVGDQAAARLGWLRAD